MDLADLLAQIRRRIEAAKRYPEEARREGIQGNVYVRFRVGEDGQVDALEVARSSGSRLLDEASLATIRRAAPFPPVRGWIRVPIAYTLGEGEP
jgi:protein TonB